MCGSGSPSVGGHGRDVHARERAVDRLLGERALRRCERLLLTQEEHEGIDEASTLHAERGLVRAQQQVDLLLDRDVERVHLDRRTPRRVRVRFGGRQLDRPQLDPPVRPRLGRGRPRDPDHLVGRHLPAGREAPRPVDQGADAEAIRFGVRKAGDLPLPRSDRLVPVPADPDVRVLRAGRARRLERAHGEVAGAVRVGPWWVGGYG
jgi:hypothetical protein